MRLRFPSCVLALALFSAAFTPASTQAQTATVRGFVTGEADGQPMPGVNVILTDTAGELFGSSTDNDGFYAISRIPVGTYRIAVSFIGFETFADTLALASGEIRTVNIALVESTTELDEVVVESERETAGAANVTAGLQTVRPADINLVPTPDISADLVNYLTVLPGVVSQGDRGGQLFIRGGEPTQNLVLLDGMVVYQPFHVVGFFSAFPSDIINSADIYAGGFGGRFGGRLSSVLDVSTRTGNKQRFVGAATIAPFVSTVRLEGPLLPGKVSFIASLRESVIEQGAEKLINEPLPFSFGDMFGKVHANLSASSQLSVTALRTHDTGQLGLNPLDVSLPGDEVNWTNQAFGLRFILLPATLPIFAEVLLSNSRLENEFGPPSAPERTTKVQRSSFAANITHYMGNIDVNWGLFLNSVNTESNLGGQFQNIQTEGEFTTEAGAYLEPEVTFSNGLRIQPGVRFQTFPSKSRTFVEPRLRVVWNWGAHRFSGAAGIYHQQVVGLNDRRDAGDVFTAWTSSPLGVVPESRHLILGWKMDTFEWMSFSLEGFYKDLKDIAVPEWVAFPQFTTDIQLAEGTALGADVRLEITKGSFYSAFSYGYSEVEYQAAFPALLALTGGSTITYAPPHDRRHQLSALSSITLFDVELSVRWQFGSGLPFNESFGFDRFILLDQLVDVQTDAGDERVLYGLPYTGRLPTYHRLDLSLERAFEISKRAAITAQAGLINVYSRNNLFYLDLFTLRRVDQLPLIPSFGLKLELK